MKNQTQLDRLLELLDVCSNTNPNKENDLENISLLESLAKDLNKTYSYGIKKLKKDILAGDAEKLDDLFRAWSSMFLVAASTAKYKKAYRRLDKMSQSFEEHSVQNYLRVCKLVDLMSLLGEEKNKYYFLYIALSNHLAQYTPDTETFQTIIDREIKNYMKFARSQAGISDSAAETLNQASPEDIEQEFQDVNKEGAQDIADYINNQSKNNKNKNNQEHIIKFDLDETALTEEEIKDLLDSLNNTDNLSEEDDDNVE